jgi:DNA-binding NarL/FixJ family response regulator
VSVRRVAIVTVPPLFADILREALAGQVAIEIVVQIGRCSRLKQRLRAARPDFILIGLRRGETDAVALSILTALPDAKVVAFSNDLHRVWVHQIQPYCTEMHDFSLDAMIALLKRPT